jgi:hypothetical protein
VSKIVEYKKGLLKWVPRGVKTLRSKGKYVEADQLRNEARKVKLIPIMGGASRKLLRHFQRLHPPLSETGRWNDATVARLKKFLVTDSKVRAAERLKYAADIWYLKRAQTHYSYPWHNLLRMQCPSLPGVAPWTDCSGMIRCMWKQLGWPDPTGMGYSTWGNSDAIIQRTRNYGKFISPGNEQLGDIACYTGGVGHAELVISRGLVLTNGNDAGPYHRGLGQHSGSMYICRLFPFV